MFRRTIAGIFIIGFYSAQYCFLRDKRLTGISGS
jgi:hypothetical protein